MPAANFSVILQNNYQPYFNFLTGFEPEANITSSALLNESFAGWDLELNYADGSHVVVNFDGPQTMFSVTNDAAGKPVVINSAVPVSIWVLNPSQSIPPVGDPQPSVVNFGGWPTWNGSIYASNFLSQWLAGNNNIGPAQNVVITGPQTIAGYGGDNNLTGGEGDNRIIDQGGLTNMEGGPSDGNPTGNDTFEFLPNVVIPASSQRGVTVSGTDSNFFAAPRPGEVNTIQSDGGNDFSLANIFWINRIVFNGGGTLTFSASNFYSNNHIASNTTFVGDANADALFIKAVGSDLNMSQMTFSNWTGQDSVSIVDDPNHVGTERIYGPNVYTVYTLGPRDSNVDAGAGGSYITSNGGNDVLIGGSGSNTIYALGGNDYLQGGVGSPSDVLVATGSGNDTFYGGSGNNYIVGSTGKNTIVAGPNGLESLYGSGTNDSSGTADYMVGGGTSCVLSEQGTGNDTLFGGLNSNNYIVGSSGNDLLVGGSLSDYIFAGNGNTTMYGGNGTDYLYTGSGTDFIWTDNVGSQSTDYIYETPTSGTNTIADFTPGDVANHDVLVMSGTNLHSFADVQAHATQGPNSPYTVISASATDQVYLYNVQPFQLTANDFIFT